MRRLGFSLEGYSLIYKCLSSTISLFIMIIDSVYGSFKPSRGIRQGDHWQCLASKGLSRMLKVVEAERRINGVKIARTAPWITHLMFVDDFLRKLMWMRLGGAKLNSEIVWIYFRKIEKAPYSIGYELKITNAWWLYLSSNAHIYFEGRI